MPELIKSSREIWGGSRKAIRVAIYLIKGAYCNTRRSWAAASIFSGQSGAVVEQRLFQRSWLSWGTPWLRVSAARRFKLCQKNLIFPSMAV